VYTCGLSVLLNFTTTLAPLFVAMSSPFSHIRPPEILEAYS
jgi:hypothetical protein